MPTPSMRDLEFYFPPMAPDRRDKFLAERSLAATKLRKEGFPDRAALMMFDAKIQAYGVELIRDR